MLQNSKPFLFALGGIATQFGPPNNFDECPRSDPFDGFVNFQGGERPVITLIFNILQSSNENPFRLFHAGFKRLGFHSLTDRGSAETQQQ